MPYVIRNGLAYWEDDFPTEDNADALPDIESEARVQAQSRLANETTLFECGECGREYKTRSGLDKHLTSKH